MTKQVSSTLGDTSLLLMKPETWHKTQTTGRITQQMDVMVQELLTVKVLNKYLHPAEVYDFDVAQLSITAHAFITPIL